MVANQLDHVNIRLAVSGGGGGIGSLMQKYKNNKNLKSWDKVFSYLQFFKYPLFRAGIALLVQGETQRPTEVSPAMWLVG